MSGNIRKQLGPIRKRLRDRITEANKLVDDEGDITTLVKIKVKLIANIESHEKTYEKLYACPHIDDGDQKCIDEELEISAELEADANEVLQAVIHRIKMEVTGPEGKKENAIEEERIQHGD